MLHEVGMITLLIGVDFDGLLWQRERGLFKASIWNMEGNQIKMLLLLLLISF